MLVPDIHFLLQDAIICKLDGLPAVFMPSILLHITPMYHSVAARQEVLHVAQDSEETLTAKRKSRAS